MHVQMVLIAVLFNLVEAALIQTHFKVMLHMLSVAIISVPVALVILLAVHILSTMIPV